MRKLTIVARGDTKVYRRNYRGELTAAILPLRREDSLVLEGAFYIDADVELDPNRYVEVQVLAGRLSETQRSMNWTYIDPFGDLEVGDTVRVPFGHNDALLVARVTGVKPEGQGPGLPMSIEVKEVAQRARFEDA